MPSHTRNSRNLVSPTTSLFGTIRQQLFKRRGTTINSTNELQPKEKAPFIEYIWEIFLRHYWPIISKQDLLNLSLVCRAFNKLLQPIIQDVFINKNPGGGTLLHAYAKKGNIAGVLDLLDRGVDIDAKMEDGNTALHFAARFGHLEVVQALLHTGTRVHGRTKGREKEEKRKKAKINISNKNDVTSICYAARNGYTEIVEILVRMAKEREVMQKWDLFGTPLLDACLNGKAETVAKLIELGANVNAVPNNDLGSPLTIAAANGHIQVMRVLLEKGAIVNQSARATGYSCFQPIHTAARGGRTKAVELLVEHGAKVDQYTTGGMTPLHYAAMNGHVLTIRKLVELHAPLEPHKRETSSPLHLAVQNGHLAAVNELISHHVPLEYPPWYTLNPLHEAVRLNNTQVVRALVQGGAKIDYLWRGVTGVHGYHNLNIGMGEPCKWTPLCMAVALGRLVMVRELLSLGASMEAETTCGLTPLHLAAATGHFETLPILLQHGADINKRSQAKGNTPLHTAARVGQTTMIWALARRGAEINARNKHNHTPLYIAKKKHRDDAVQALVSLGATL